MKTVAQFKVGDVVKLFFGHRRRGYADQTKWDRGSRVEGHYHRRDGPRWRVEHVGYCVGGDLTHRGIETDLLVKEILDDTDAEHSGGFLMLDPHRLACLTFESAHDVTFHHDRRHPWKEGNDLHCRGIKSGEEVGRKASVRKNSENEGYQRSNDDEVR